MASTEAAVGRNVAELRKKRDHTVRSLAQQLDELGVPIDPSGITKIENGTRRPRDHEILALAVALGVNPSRLLLPVGEPIDEVALTPALTVPVGEAWAWALAQRALPGADDEDFEVNAVPRWLRRGTDHTASRAALDVLRRVQQLVQARQAAEAAPDDVPVRRRGRGADAIREHFAQSGDPDAVRRALRRLVAEIDDLLAEEPERGER